MKTTKQLQDEFYSALYALGANSDARTAARRYAKKTGDTTLWDELSERRVHLKNTLENARKALLMSGVSS